MEFTKTEKGQGNLIRNGYIYVFKKILANEVSSWGCILRRKGNQCKATIKLSPTDNFIVQVSEHTHAPSQTEVEETKVKSRIKRKATTTLETPQQILGTELRNISEGAAASLPGISTIRGNIRKACKDLDTPPNHATREEIPELPEQYQLTVNRQQFMIFDSGIRDHERKFIFASELGLQCLAESEHFYADGTFKVSPELFFQLYTIHGHQRGNIFPCVFGLLPNKTEATYTRFFREVFGQINEPVVTDILVDFERGAINAIRNASQDIEEKGCFYHLCSNVWKRIQHLGLQQRYNDDQEFSLHLRMLCDLAFLPPDDVVQGFEDLTDHIRINYQGEVENLLEYFEDTFIGRHRRNARRRTAMFPVVL